MSWFRTGVLVRGHCTAEYPAVVREIIARLQIHYDNAQESSLLFKACAGSLETNCRMAKLGRTTAQCDRRIWSMCPALEGHQDIVQRVCIHEVLGFVGDGSVLSETRKPLGGVGKTKKLLAGPTMNLCRIDKAAVVPPTEGSDTQHFHNRHQVMVQIRGRFEMSLISLPVRENWIT